jgi:flagellar M-ring protein FliF
MNSLSQLARQLLRIWKQLGLNQKISVLVAATAVLGALAGVVFWSSRVDFAILYGRLDDAEAAKVVSVLDEMKVPHKVGQDGAAIYVPKDKVHTMRMTLASRGIPRGDGGVGFEIFDKPNFGISDFIQHANYTRAIQGELSRTISQLDEVEAARVMIVVPENRLLTDNSKRPTASVFIRVKGHAALQPSAVNSIRFLVANAVEGLTPNNVTVVDNRMNVLSENSDTDSAGGLTASQLSARRSLEQYLSKKAEGMLEAVLGPGQAVVRVSADLNFDTLTRTEEKYDPDGQVARSTTLTDETTDTINTAAAGGAPGVAVNIGAETNSAGTGPANTSRTKKKNTDTEYEINKITSSLSQLAGGLKRVSAAVLVATRTEGVGKARKTVPREPQELEKLRRIVQSALGIQPTDTTRKDEITLEEMPFNDQFADTAQDLGHDATKQFWWQQVQNLVFPVLGIGVVIVFLRMLKRTPEAPGPAQGSEGDLASMPLGGIGGGFQDEMAPGVGAGRLGSAYQRGSRPGVVTVETLNQLVRENPTSVTQAIQSWLNRKPER